MYRLSRLVARENHSRQREGFIQNCGGRLSVERAVCMCVWCGGFVGMEGWEGRSRSDLLYGKMKLSHESQADCKRLIPKQQRRQAQMVPNYWHRDHTGQEYDWFTSLPVPPK